MDLESSPIEKFAEPLTYYEPIATLFDLATCQAALNLLNSCIIRGENDKRSAKRRRGNFHSAVTLDENYCDDYNNLVKSQNLPYSIERLIYQFGVKVLEGMKEFKRRINKLIFPNNLSKYRIRRIDPSSFCVCETGCIDHERTAKNMVRGPTLNMAQKFSVMCKFCMVSEIKTVSLSVLPADFIAKVNFNENFLIFYWIRYLENDLDITPLEMANICGSFDWPAFEYFWDQLGIHDQISVAKTNAFVEIDEFYARALSKMTSYHQRMILPEIFVEVIVSFWNKPEWALKTWTRVKEICTVDQLSQIFTKLGLTSFLIDTQSFYDFWITAPLDLRKSYVANDENKRFNIIEIFKNRSISQIGMKFLLDYLSFKNIRSRQEMLLRVAGEFTNYFINCSQQIIEILDFCFPCDREKTEFKKTVVNSLDTRDHFSRLVNCGRFDTLSYLFQIYSSSASETAVHVERFLKSEDVRREIFLFNFHRWLKLSEFIDQVLSVSYDHPTSAPIKKQFVSTSVNYFNLNGWSEWAEIGLKIDQVAGVVEHVFDPTETTVLKQSWLVDFQNNVLRDLEFWKEFDEQNFNKFVSWCLECDDNDQRVAEFKNALPIDDICEDMLKNIYRMRGCYRNNMIGLRILQKCLNWYFTNAKERTECVLRLMHSLDDARVNKTFRKTHYIGLANFFLLIFEDDLAENQES